MGMGGKLSSGLGLCGKRLVQLGKGQKKLGLIFPHVFYIFGHLIQYSEEKHGPRKKIPPWQQSVLIKELSKTPSFIAFQMYG